MKSYKYRIKEQTTSRLVKGVEMQNGQVSHQHVADKNQEGYRGSKGPHTRQPQPRVPVPDK